MLDGWGEWEQEVDGRGCAIPKQGNKSRKKTTQEPGNMIQNRSAGNSQDGEERNGWDRSFAAAQTATSPDQTRKTKASQKNISKKKEKVLKLI